MRDFERKMGLLVKTQEHQSPGRWLLAPRKGEAFMGPRERERARVRARRRRVFTGLLEAVGITFLIGLFPPLRGMLWVTLALALALGAYCSLLVRYRVEESERRATSPRGPADLGVPLGPAAPAARPDRDLFDGLGLGNGDKVHVVVRVREDLEPATNP
ncbi:MAG: hypothetical protein HY658_01595 [Actinobacteria bacterium]|nr:hypothetical protein [Actinomycetota bacterium]